MPQTSLLSTQSPSKKLPLPSRCVSSRLPNPSGQGHELVGRISAARVQPRTSEGAAVLRWAAHPQHILHTLHSLTPWVCYASHFKPPRYTPGWHCTMYARAPCVLLTLRCICILHARHALPAPRPPLKNTYCILRRVNGIYEKLRVIYACVPCIRTHALIHTTSNTSLMRRQKARNRAACRLVLAPPRAPARQVFCAARATHPRRVIGFLL